jgi:hypothetical protein
LQELVITFCDLRRRSNHVSATENVNRDIWIRTDLTTLASWDTQFSPVDVRTLTEGHRAFVGGRLIFDRQADGRTKTGRAAIGTLSKRTERLVRVSRELANRTASRSHSVSHKIRKLV